MHSLQTWTRYPASFDTFRICEVVNNFTGNNSAYQRSDTVGHQHEQPLRAGADANGWLFSTNKDPEMLKKSNAIPYDHRHHQKRSVLPQGCRFRTIQTTAPTQKYSWAWRFWYQSVSGRTELLKWKVFPKSEIMRWADLDAQPQRCRHNAIRSREKGFSKCIGNLQCCTKHHRKYKEDEHFRLAKEYKKHQARKFRPTNCPSWLLQVYRLACWANKYPLTIRLLLQTKTGLGFCPAQQVNAPHGNDKTNRSPNPDRRKYFWISMLLLARML